MYNLMLYSKMLMIHNMLFGIAYNHLPSRVQTLYNGCRAENLKLRTEKTLLYPNGIICVCLQVHVIFNLFS